MTIHYSPTIQAILAIALGASMSMTPAVAVAQSPQVEASAPTRVYIESDAKALGERGDGMQGALIRELRAAFEAGGVELLDADEDDPDAVRLRIRFHGKAEDVYLFKYELHFELIDGKTATQLTEPVVCTECFDPALYKALTEHVPALIDAIEAESADDTHGTGPTPPTGDGDTRDGDTGDGDGDSTVPPPKPIGPLGYAGLGVAVVGLGVTISGAVELSLGRVYSHTASYYKAIGKDHRPIGYALIGAGAAATVAGLVMLGVDAGRRAKLRKQTRAQVLVIPSISPSNAGVGIIGRF